MATGSAEPERIPRLHLVTDDRVLARPDFVEVAAELMAVGGDRVALHVRGHALSAAAQLERASRCATVGRRTGARVLVNDRVDIALAAGADGVHLAEGSYSARVARTLLGADALVGASVHDREGAERRAAEGADFLFGGTLYPTASHPGRAGRGAAWLGELTIADVPVIGIGGITVERAAEVRGAGGYGVAVIRAVWDAASPVDALAAFIEVLE